MRNLTSGQVAQRNDRRGCVIRDVESDIATLKEVWNKMKVDLNSQSKEYQDGVREVFNSLFINKKMGDFLYEGEARTLEMKLLDFEPE